jgi:hypothetical protein
MTRVVERECPGNISPRKLVIETAKVNVISCYSCTESIATLRRVPAPRNCFLARGYFCGTNVEQGKSYL